MAKKLLIDATHAEETRVVVLDGNKVEEFDFETIHKRQLAGNIYLAKVTRVEPSLQAAFVDYGGNRHGFLAFAEIHPDYYQIPVADRKALLDEERAAAREADDDGNRRSRRRRDDSGPKEPRAEATVEPVDSVDAEGVADDSAPQSNEASQTPMAAQAEGMDQRSYGAMDIVELDEDESSDANSAPDEDEPREAYRAADHATENDEEIESVADEDVSDEVRPQRRSRARRYKIQEVVKVRQIMLVQVVKEERGNKGAALTTYLSLAGRYCVLMPNTARGGGISRKITNAADRKKLKEIAGEFSVPEGAGLIIRTAGANRTKPEIKRDYEYLFRLWEQIRELTLKSIAPAPIYEEGNLIKRSIRDLYNKDIDEVLVEGEGGYRTAKDFMQMIMPSHARSVQLYAEPMPLFARFQVESYLASMFNPTVQLKSGGYIVIGVTEALVAIDINSGKSTREGSIEDTALKTNLEAADEIARQLRLRDLAGLIVIDFIDMEERKNNAAVEKRIKEALRNDRARIQVGRISGFGLLEMSRQRLRPGMIEATTQPCPHCHGTGLIRSDNSLALQILRALEEEGTRARSKEALVKAPVGIVNYLFNSKREHLAQIELRYGMAIRLEGDPSLVSPDYSIEKFKTATRIVQVVSTPVISLDAQTMSGVDEDFAEEFDDEIEVEAELVEEAAEAVEASEPKADSADTSDQPKRKRRRRRRRKPGGSNGENAVESGDDGDESDDGDDENGEANGEPPATTPAPEPVAVAAEASVEADVIAEAAPKKPARTRRSRAKPKVDAAAEATETEAAPEAASDAAPVEEAPKKRTRTRRKPTKAEEPVAEVEAKPAAEPAPGAIADPVAETPAPAPQAPAEPEVAPPPPAAGAPAGSAAAEALVETPAPAVTAEPEPVVEAEGDAPTEAPTDAPTDSRPRRAGWWARKS
ncbi:MAG: ribonuclease E/G [Pararhodobacter sp.]